MMRLMCGSDLYTEVEAGQRAELLSRIDNGHYWNRADPLRPWRTSYHSDFDGIGKTEDLCNVAGNGRMLRTLVTWREVTGDGSLDKVIRELVGGLGRIAVRRGDYAY